MINILIAIPTAKYIESATFKSIYDLIVPEGVNTTFQTFYGYNIDQVRNLIVSGNWGGHQRFDYVFCVDSDIELPSNALIKLLSHNVDIVSGIYIQRIPHTHNLEVFAPSATGDMPRMTIDQLLPQGLHEVGGSGFGCTLIKSDVLRKMTYPHFVYKSAIDHKDTFSEDAYFCKKARELGFKVFVDSSVLCRHHGSWVYEVITPAPVTVITTAPVSAPVEEKLFAIAQLDLIPETHKQYLQKMRTQQGVKPKVIYDIGANYLHWTREARSVWPEADIIAFDATTTLEPLYRAYGEIYHIDVLGNEDGKDVIFYQNNESTSGNSYYKENVKFSPAAAVLYTDNTKTKRAMRTLDSVALERGFAKPNLIKIDTQGAELDILKGAQKTLKHCDHLILELQHEEYNLGSPHVSEVIEYLKTIGFEMVASAKEIDKNDVAGDYHFKRVR